MRACGAALLGKYLAASTFLFYLIYIYISFFSYRLYCTNTSGVSNTGVDWDRHDCSLFHGLWTRATNLWA
ncbi:hypothetical protein I7I53_00351 [Histoplasma capsulatum var. duboisii H88]|uniref:Uncharacterized protein n=1 Tax=Ajellomyces capsulatus (strain H88) TaxID=544711 RepID=A0A8A1LMR9_AJEC8|nr:hypothetical protein I7I53_00351 [Histoplasma capsulatum var. duboisii H88]